MSHPEDISFFDELDSLTTREPFPRHEIVMASGTRHTVDRRDAVSVGSSVIVIMREDGSEHLLRHAQVSEVHIPGAG